MHCLQEDLESVLGRSQRWYTKPLGFCQWVGNLRRRGFPKLIQCSMWGQRSHQFPPDSLPCLGDLPADTLSHAQPFSMLMAPHHGHVSPSCPSLHLSLELVLLLLGSLCPLPQHRGPAPRCPFSRHHFLVLLPVKMASVSLGLSDRSRKLKGQVSSCFAPHSSSKQPASP